jgi:hypothetical protein
LLSLLLSLHPSLLPLFHSISHSSLSLSLTPPLLSLSLTPLPLSLSGTHSYHSLNSRLLPPLSLRCTPYCTHHTVLILYSPYCTHHTVLTILYSYCTHHTVLTILYSPYCTLLCRCTLTPTTHSRSLAPLSHQMHTLRQNKKRDDKMKAMLSGLNLGGNVSVRVGVCCLRV